MKNKTCLLNILLAAVLGLVLLAALLLRTLLPRFILPRLDIPNMVLLSLIALVLESYLAPGGKRCWWFTLLAGAVTFGLLPFAACFVGLTDALKLVLAGGVTFGVTTWLFTAIRDRIATGPVARLAPIAGGLGLYLAAQAFMSFL